MKQAHFDNAAILYDNSFTHTRIARAQREQVWSIIDRMALPPHQHLLEINCGTGEDAHIWSEKGHVVIATDISSEMIAKAKSKYPGIDFRMNDMRKLRELDSRFDVLFSNFGGLNCLSPPELIQLFRDSAALCNPNGRLILVIMGRKSHWDYWYLLFKGRFKERNRRNTDQALSVSVNGTNVPTYYYSPQQIRQIAQNFFQVEQIRPIGYFVPPSYLSSFFDRHPRLFRLLEKADKLISFSWLANRSDHYLISLRKT